MMKYKIIYKIYFEFYKGYYSGKYLEINQVSRTNKAIKINPLTDIFSEEEIYMAMFRSIIPYYNKVKNTNKGIKQMLTLNLEKIISEEELFYMKLSNNLNEYYSIKEL